MTQRQFNTAIKKHQERVAYEREKRIQEIERQEKLAQPHSRWEAVGMTIDDVLTLMEIKASTGAFQTFDPRDFGADYDFVPVPLDGTPEADYWMIGSKYTDQNEIQ